MQQPGASSARVPDELESPRAKLVYLYLSTSGWCTVPDVQHALGLKKITLFSILESLRRRNLVEQQGNAFRCHPEIESA